MTNSTNQFQSAAFINLFIGYNKEEDFRILICAWDEEDAQELAAEYGKDSGLAGEWEIREIEGGIDNIHFDCDYVINHGDKA